MSRLKVLQARVTAQTTTTNSVSAHILPADILGPVEAAATEIEAFEGMLNATTPFPLCVSIAYLTARCEAAQAALAKAKQAALAEAATQ